MALSVASRATYLNCSFKPGIWSGDTAPVQFYDPVNFTKMEIKSQTQEPDRLVSNLEGSIGEALASVMKPKDSANLSAEADYMPPWMLGLLLGADITELAQTTSAVADEVITPVVGIWVPLANKYLAANTTETPIVAETTVETVDSTIANTHYSIDLINGLFKALDATGATVTKISYHKAARTGEIYKGGKAKSAYIKLVGTGTEKVSQRRCRVVIHKVNLSATGAIDPVSGGYLKGSFSGDMLTPTSETSPWEYLYLDMAV